MGLFNLFGNKTDNGLKIYEQDMVNLGRELVDLYLEKKGIPQEQLEPLDSQILTVYLFGLVAAVNMQENRGFSPQDMGKVEVTVIRETFHQSRTMAQVSAHEIVEQTKTHDPANPIYGILSRGGDSWENWHRGWKDKVVEDLESVVQMMHDIQNNLPVTPQAPKEELPVFRYHPHVYEHGDVVNGEGVCQCCGRTVQAYVDRLYCDQDVHCLCMDCVKSGKAAETFGGEFQKDVDAVAEDPEHTDELLHRTPGYRSWQGEHWLTCCGDYCAYEGPVGADELKALGIAKEVCSEYESREDAVAQNVLDLLDQEGPMTGYLFKCLHCGEYHLWVDIQ